MNFINGTWKEASHGSLDMINPSYNTVIGKIARSSSEDIHEAVTAARTCFEETWGPMPAVERGRILHKASEILSRHTLELAEIESADTGKPLKQATSDANLAVRYFEYYAGAADKLFGETIPYQNGFSVFTYREPFGVTGHIIPWNYPLQMACRTLAPALAVGNTVILKPAEDASLSIVRMFELLETAGFPAGALNLVTGLGDEAGAALASHPGIDHLAFTGSPEVGTHVMKSMAENRRPVVLELGGKSPQIVFDDADLDAAFPVIINAIIQNAGQTCSAGSRLVIHRSLEKSFTKRLIERFKSLRVGPADTDPDVGPIINEKQLRRVRTLVETAVENGARILAQAEVPEGSGFYYPPTLVGQAAPEDFIAQNEVFGPVLTVIPFDTEEDAIRIANGTPYGLTAAVWTRDNGRVMRVSKKLVAGQVFVNTYGAGGGVELPFGGMKGSGFGREKGMEALYHVTTTKTVVMKI